MVFRQHRRAAAILAPVTMIAAFAVAGAASPAAASTSLIAAADSVTSPSGMVAVSVPAPVEAGVASTYTMTVTNETSSAFDGPVGVVALGTVPAGITINRIAGCARLGGNQATSISCSMPNLAPGASETATFTLVAAAAGDYQIPFGAAAEIPDPGAPGAFDSVSDQVTLPVSVTPGPTDIQVTGSSNNGSPPAGGNFMYTFQIKDNGPLPASGVTFDDALPASILLGSTLTIDHGTCTANPAANSVHCDIGSLGTGQQSDITFSATPTTTGVIATAATVAMAGTDTNPVNNKATVTVQPR